MSEAVTASMVHGYEVMQRRTTSYDYEKVFWNSAFGLGLVGMGWVAVKLGWIISDLQEIQKAVVSYAETVQEILDDPRRSLRINEYLFMWDAVVGPHKDVPVNNYEQGRAIAVDIMRRDLASDTPYIWAEYVADIKSEYPEITFDEEDKMLTEKEVEARDASPSALKVLEALDTFYTRFGAAAPVAVLAGNIGFEYMRVWRLKRDLR